MILAQRWYNVHVPTLDELRWSNIGTMPMQQSDEPHLLQTSPRKSVPWEHVDSFRRHTQLVVMKINRLDLDLKCQYSALNTSFHMFNSCLCIGVICEIYSM